MMVMNSADSTFFTLNEVATAIFQAADGRTPLREIVRDRICQQFDIDPEQAQADAEQFVADLSSHGILWFPINRWLRSCPDEPVD